MPTLRPTTPPSQKLIPKSYSVLREGYSLSKFRDDVLAGLTVAIVALPLAMALAIASGTTPDKGLITCVVAGFIISALGGSRVQIGGPTGAFVVVVFGVIASHGYQGLVIATFMAGAILVVAGLLRLGDYIKYIPQPVVTGFTAGIALIIASSQLRDAFGLTLAKAPGNFLEQWQTAFAARETLNLAALALTLMALFLILLLRAKAPKWPALLIAVASASLFAKGLHLPVETIGTRFGGIARGLPAPQIPTLDWPTIQALLPASLTIAFLAGIESLLSAVVADGMIGRRHRPNMELIAEGLANSASALFGGMPATGAIARTATNIRSGAHSPVAGMVHALFVLAFMVFAAPLANDIPLSSLAAVLLIVAWNMSEAPHVVAYIRRAPLGDTLALLITFGLTLFADLSIAIASGVIFSSILFMHRMAQSVKAVPLARADNQRAGLPKDVEVFALSGPLFFGAASRLLDVLEHIGTPLRAIILRLENVGVIDTSGVAALRDFVTRTQRQHTLVVLCGVQDAPRTLMMQLGLTASAHLIFCADFAAARGVVAPEPLVTLSKD